MHNTAFKIYELRAANPCQIQNSKLCDVHSCPPTHHPQHPAINQAMAHSVNKAEEAGEELESDG